MQLRGAPPEDLGAVDVGARQIADGLWRRRRREIEDMRRREQGRVRSIPDDRFVVEAPELSEGVAPSVGLARHELLGDREVRGGFAGRHVFERCGDARRASEGRARGEVFADLDVGVRSMFDAAKQLEDQPIAVRDRGVALLSGQALHRERTFAAQLGERGRPPRAHGAALHADDRVGVERLEQRLRAGIVGGPVDHQALARAGDARQGDLRRCARIASAAGPVTIASGRR